MVRVKERHCMYCAQFKQDIGFKFVIHMKSQTKRGMCPSCQTKRKIPHAQLIEMAERDKNERKKK